MLTLFQRLWRWFRIFQNTPEVLYSRMLERFKIMCSPSFLIQSDLCIASECGAGLEYSWILCRRYFRWRPSINGHSINGHSINGHSIEHGVFRDLRRRWANWFMVERWLGSTMRRVATWVLATHMCQGHEICIQDEGVRNDADEVAES